MLNPILYLLNIFVVVQQLSCVLLFVTLWFAAHQVSLSFTIFQGVLKFISIDLVMPSNHFILCRPHLLMPTVFPSIKVLTNESTLCIKWAKYWNFSFNISPFNEYSGLISFRIDWLDFLAVQGTLMSLLQPHSLQASILQCSAFSVVQLSTSIYDYWETIALIIKDPCQQSVVSTF